MALGPARTVCSEPIITALRRLSNAPEAGTCGVGRDGQKILPGMTLIDATFLAEFAALEEVQVLV